MTTRLLSTLAVSAAAVLTLASCGGDEQGQQQDAPAEDSAAGLTLEEVQEAGVLTVGTEGTYRPFSFHEGGAGELTGYDVEIVTAVAEELGVEADFEETQWDAMFAGLESERFDVIANQVSINPEREASYLFSEPYTVSPGVVVVAEGTTDITGLGDLEGKTTAQSLTSNWHTVAEENGANVESVEGWAQAVALLEQGRVDATVNDQLTFLDYTKEHPDSPITVAAGSSTTPR